MSKGVAGFRMTEAHALQIIRDVAEDTERVYFTAHAITGMRKRRITNTEVLRVLRNGRITEAPYAPPQGGWKTTVESFEAGRNLRIIVVVDTDDLGNHVLVITAHEI
jgi:hypothetical protein